MLNLGQAVKEGDFVTKPETKRKKIVRRKTHGRTKRRFIIFLFLLVCIGTIFVVLKAPFFNVKTIVCVGQTALSEDEVIKIAGAKTDVNIFSTGVGTMKRRLAAHPSIAECNVRRLFPNKIKIWVRESRAIACVEQNGLFLLMEKNGQIIKSIDAKAEDAAKGIARLENFKPASSKVGDYAFNHDDAAHKVTLECIETLDELGMIDKVTGIDSSDLSDIKIDYEDRLSVLIGDYEKMQYKLTFIKKVIDEELSRFEKAKLDYRGSSLYVGSISEEQPEVSEQEPGNAQTEQTEDTQNEETENTEKAEN